MVPIIISFDDFLTEKQYLALQNTFLTNDFFYMSSEKDQLYIPQENLKIQIPSYRIDILFQIEKDPKLDTVVFEGDFLDKEIPKMADLYFERIKKGAKDANRYSPEELKYFIIPIIESLNICVEHYKRANYLPTRIKKILVTEAEKLIELCDTYYTNPYSGIKKKLPLKWTRTEIEYFFHLLRENKQLGEINNADLGRIIDNTIECVEDKTVETFKPIKSSYKHLSAFSTDEGRPQSAANEKLKQIFNKDFFNH